MPLIKKLSARLQNHPKRIVYPEGADPRILQAARRNTGIRNNEGRREGISCETLAFLPPDRRGLAVYMGNQLGYPRPFPVILRTHRHSVRNLPPKALPLPVSPSDLQIQIRDLFTD